MPVQDMPITCKQARAIHGLYRTARHFDLPMRCITPVCHGSITWTDILQMTNYLAIWLVRLGRSSKSECGCAKLTLRDPLSSAARNPNLSLSGLYNAARRVSSEINLDIRCRCRLLHTGDVEAARTNIRFLPDPAVRQSRREWLLWVIQGKPHSEHMFSGLPPIADLRPRR